MKRVDIILKDAAPDGGSVLLFPKPFQLWDRSYDGLELGNIGPPEELTVLNSDQRAFQARPDNGALPLIGYEISLGERSAAATIWVLPKGGTQRPDLQARGTD